ncbi:MAG TPA: DinB family protein [Pyrinomonadaceae bacterium]|nr:DinB family protein [Pyrinomonadaceae bacterium]
MNGRPEANEAAEYYSLYIDRIPEHEIVPVLERQLNETIDLLQQVSEEKSQYRYAPDKWSMRELLNHVNDTERVFLYRALWFARGFSDALPAYDQNVAAAAAHANDFSWASHVSDFRAVHEATLTFFRNLPDEAWSRGGVASDNRVTVRALAYIIAGHLAHHIAVLKEKYLTSTAHV